MAQATSTPVAVIPDEPLESLGASLRCMDAESMQLETIMEFLQDQCGDNVTAITFMLQPHLTQLRGEVEAMLVHLDEMKKRSASH